jgi:hypothetical protein
MINNAIPLTSDLENNNVLPLMMVIKYTNMKLYDPGANGLVSILPIGIFQYVML